jgi:hypothetical protein
MRHRSQAADFAAHLTKLVSGHGLDSPCSAAGRRISVSNEI